MIIKTFEKQIEMTVKTQFVHFYPNPNLNEEENYLTEDYKVGDTLLVLAKVKTDSTDTGYGYIAYDEKIGESFVVDSALLIL